MVQDSLGNAKLHQGAWITIGSFDGVHAGHRLILKKLIDGARSEDQPSVVVTFHPHPAKVLRPFPDPFYLSTPEEKDAVLSKLGLSSVLTLEFSLNLAGLSAIEFMSILHHQLNFSCLLIGYDFKLGANREGDFLRLQEIGKELGYCVRALDPLQSISQVISSSLIRKKIGSGEISEANTLLGYPYPISGEIIHGDGRGKHIGIPTANIEPWHEKLIPSNGVYAAMASVKGGMHKAVVNIGHRPTFYLKPAKKTIEIHLLDFNKEIYGNQLKLEFHNRIRDELKFGSAEELMDQIKKDIMTSRKVLENAPIEKYLSA